MLKLLGFRLFLRLSVDLRELLFKIIDAGRLLNEIYKALSLWVDFLHSDDPVRQRVSLRRLAQVGSLPAQVIGELLRLLDQDDPAIRRRAVETLSSASNLPEDAMSAICRAIADSEPGFPHRPRQEGLECPPGPPFKPSNLRTSFLGLLACQPLSTPC